MSTSQLPADATFVMTVDEAFGIPDKGLGVDSHGQLFVEGITVIAGTIQCERVSVGDRLAVVSDDYYQESRCMGVERSCKTFNEALAGEYVGVAVRGQFHNDFKPGMNVYLVARAMPP